MRYMIDKKNKKVVGTVEVGHPDLDELRSRGIEIIEGKDVNIRRAILKNGKIYERELTSEELRRREEFKRTEEKKQNVTN